ncbi:transcriptional regulator with XRE-family HTH domain [Paraburkholderia sp. JPY158]|uniref:Transcriptional regulator with XRE-family HTH domain n=1 Tax=Paraburkholderia atlantica TaxID=2654982 RepID=A0A7W8QEY7_PARAM|nr:helix-turn-helix transcriptional regulator [Paraburkholderia atlantica]MBB5429020.1 transcriptional regulator with XRE-family HTH domain [Paraburkholderia atlantica]
MKKKQLSTRELFASRLHELRTRQQLSATWLAKLAGLQYGTPGTIERTSANVELKTIAALARALRVSPESFFCDRLIRQASPPSNDEFIELFRINLRDARIAAGMTQEDLSEAAGAHRDYVWHLEKSGANVTLDVTDALARAVGVSVRELVRPRKEEYQVRAQPLSASRKSEADASVAVEFQEARKIFGARLRHFREARGMSAKEFVQRGWRRPWFRLEEIEEGTGDLTFDFIARTCSALEVHPASMFTYSDFPYQRDFTRVELVAHVYGRIEVFSAMRQMFHTELTRKAGLTTSLVANMRAGKGGGMLSSVGRLAQALHVHVWQLFV